MSSPVARSRRVLPLLALITALIGIAGCTANASVGTAKTDGTRSTVAADVNTGVKLPPSANANFTAAKLRLVNPCGLLDKQTMARFGTSSEGIGATSDGIDSCDDQLNDARGNDLDLTITVGSDLSEYHPTGTIAGLPAAEDSTDSACFVRVITQQHPTTGIEIQSDYDKNDSCPPARELAQSVVDRIRTDPPLRADVPGSLAPVDPCSTLDDQTAATVLAGTPDKQYDGLFECEWQTDSYDLTVRLSIDQDPKDDTTDGTPQPVDVGVPAYESTDNDVYPTCDVKWLTHSTGDGFGDVVDIEFGNVADTSGIDACTQAVTVAKVVATKVPKAS